MSYGAKLCLNSVEDKEKFKDAINRNTTLGSHIESGDHLRGVISPMCDYDTQSVINTLKHELLVNGDVDFSGENTSKKIKYYKEEWT